MASWFYLTLWRGNPPEMTDYTDIAVDVGDGHSTIVLQKDGHAETIDPTDRAVTEISDTDSSSIVVEERDEVTWIVGKNH